MQMGELRHREVKSLVHGCKWRGWSVRGGWPPPTPDILQTVEKPWLVVSALRQHPMKPQPDTSCLPVCIHSFTHSFTQQASIH